MTASPRIIPIASGKGGVGKTFLAANLAIALARAGHATIVVDMDLGGSNLHSFLGLPNRFPGIGDFLRARSAGLEELVMPADIPGLSFLPGEGRTPFMANIPFAQKVRLVTHIKRLEADYILLDLGAGTTFNTLDFFRLSPRGILITTPELPAIMGMLSFAKNFLLRYLSRRYAKHQEIAALLHSVTKQPLSGDPVTVEALRTAIYPLNQEAGEEIGRICRAVRPRIIFNMGEQPDEMTLSGHIDKSLQDILSMEADYFGFIYNDPNVRRAVRRRVPFLPHYQDSLAARGLVKTAERIDKYWDKTVQGSARLVMDHAERLREDPSSSAARP